jgi:hypothetical protein
MAARIDSGGEMATQHTVKQGEYLSRIAAGYGFQDYRAIWNHPNNAKLAKLRKTPNVLFPGDVLFIPDKQIKKEMIPTEKVHRFRLSVPSLKLRIVIKDYHNQAISNADCELEVEGVLHKVRSDAQGLIEHEILRTAEEGKLRILSFGIEIPLKIGHLHPVDEESGWKARLINLGYYEDEADALHLRYAIEEFQLDHKVKVTGEFDDTTKAKLKEAYGC